MSDSRPRLRLRRLPLSLAGAAVIAVCAGGTWIWLGRQLPDQAPGGLERLLTLASLRDVLLPAATTLMPAAQMSTASISLRQSAPMAPAVVAAPAALVMPLLSTEPDVAAPAAGPGMSAPSFDIVRVAPSGDAVLAGRAAPGTHVTISDNGQAIALATADNEGQWVALPTAPLPEGGQTLTIVSSLISPAPSDQTAPARILLAGTAPLLVVVPEHADVTATSPVSASAASTSSAIAASVGAQTAVAVLMPPGAAPRVLQGLPVPRGEHGPASRLGLDVVDYDPRGAIRFGGSAPPGTSLRAYIDNHPAGDAVADADGYWSVLPDAAVPPGDHRLRVDALSGSRVTARVEVPFERSPTTEVEVRDDRIVVQPRETLWRIARRTYGQGMRYTVIFQANRDQIRDPDRIFPGQVISIPARVDHAEAAVP